MSEITEVRAPGRRVNSSDEILGTLSGWIADGRLKIGSLLPAERKLALQLGVSRVVVREASKKLEERGMVEIRQGVGVRVINNPSLPIQGSLYTLVPAEKQRLQQCGQARVLIEPELAAFAALRVNPVSLQKMAAIQEALLREQDIPKAALLDIEFHQVVSELSGNQVLALMLSSIVELGRLSREHTLREFGVRRAYDFHQKIFATIAAGDAVAARQAMKAHLTAALGDLS